MAGCLVSSEPAQGVAVGDEMASLRSTIKFQKARIQALQEELDSAVKGASERGQEVAVNVIDCELHRLSDSVERTQRREQIAD